MNIFCEAVGELVGSERNMCKVRSTSCHSRSQEIVHVTNTIHVSIIFGAVIQKIKKISLRGFENVGEKYYTVICWITSCSFTKNLAGNLCSSPSLCCLQEICYPCAYSLQRHLLQCSIPALSTLNAWTNAQQSSLQGSCTAENLSGLPSNRGLTPCSIVWAVLLWDWINLDVLYDRNQNLWAYIWQRHQHWFEIAEYSNRMYRVRLFMPVTQCSFEQISFSCEVAPSLPKRSAWGINWRFYALHWLFCKNNLRTISFWFLSTWQRYWSRPAGPANCKQCSESFCMLCYDIFNFRYSSMSSCVNLQHWQN